LILVQKNGTMNEEQKLENEENTSSVNESATSEESANQEGSVKDSVDEVALLTDKYKRLYADFENFRRQSVKARTELLAVASKEVMLKMLPVLDDFERAIKANETVEDPQSLKQGFELIYGIFKRNLESEGLKSFESTGELFNTDFHEAVTKIPAPEESLKNKVVHTLENGYMLNDKVVRYAKVVVGE
jgi:molecular chaperone GrpE